MKTAESIRKEQDAAQAKAWRPVMKRIEMAIDKAIEQNPHADRATVGIAEETIMSGRLGDLSTVLEKLGYITRLRPSLDQHTRCYPLVVIWR